MNIKSQPPTSPQPPSNIFVQHSTASDDVVVAERPQGTSNMMTFTRLVRYRLFIVFQIIRGYTYSILTFVVLSKICRLYTSVCLIVGFFGVLIHFCWWMLYGNLMIYLHSRKQLNILPNNIVSSSPWPLLQNSSTYQRQYLHCYSKLADLVKKTQIQGNVIPVSSIHPLARYTFPAIFNLRYVAQREGSVQLQKIANIPVHCFKCSLISGAEWWIYVSSIDAINSIHSIETASRC